MTTTTPTSLAARARALAGRRSQVFATATAVLTLVGVVAALTDHYGLAIITVLLLQACLAAYLVTGPGGSGVSAATVQRQVDLASARTLADLTRTRQAVLDAIDAQKRDV